MNKTLFRTAKIKYYSPSYSPDVKSMTLLPDKMLYFRLKGKGGFYLCLPARFRCTKKGKTIRLNRVEKVVLTAMEMKRLCKILKAS